NAGARSDHVHHTAIDDRRRFLRSRRKTARPSHAQLSDIAFVDLVEWTETMLIVRSTDVQPVGWIGIGLDRLADRDERSGLRSHRNRRSPKYNDREQRRNEIQLIHHPASYLAPEFEIILRIHFQLILNPTGENLTSICAGRALHKKSWAVIDRPYSLGCATVGALYERPRCIFCAKPLKSINCARRS